MKIGVAQIPMAWTLEENTKTVCQTIQNHRHVQALVFPELTLSGFHKNIRQQTKPDVMEACLSQIQQQCAAHNTTVFCGTPVKQGNVVMNSYYAINAVGDSPRRWDKVGLTPSEAKYFSPGTGRQTLEMRGMFVSVVMCREIMDLEWFASSLKGHQLDLVFWPGYIGDNDQDITSNLYLQQATEMARRLQVTLVQCNWPHSLNDTAVKGMGASRIITPDGRVAFQMPSNEPGVGVFEVPPH